MTVESTVGGDLILIFNLNFGLSVFGTFHGFFVFSRDLVAFNLLLFNAQVKLSRDRRGTASKASHEIPNQSILD